MATFDELIKELTKITVDIGTNHTFIYLVKNNMPNMEPETFDYAKQKIADSIQELFDIEKRIAVISELAKNATGTNKDKCFTRLASASSLVSDAISIFGNTEPKSAASSTLAGHGSMYRSSGSRGTMTPPSDEEDNTSAKNCNVNNSN